jgi:sulfur carrier protein
VRVIVNGESRELSHGATVLVLLESLGLRSDRVAVEINAQIIRRARHAEHILSDGDQVEIVTFVGGG